MFVRCKTRHSTARNRAGGQWGTFGDNQGHTGTDGDNRAAATQPSAGNPDPGRCSRTSAPTHTRAPRRKTNGGHSGTSGDNRGHSRPREEEGEEEKRLRFAQTFGARALALLAVTALTAAGCGSSDDKPAAQTPAPDEPVVLVHQFQFKDWPLTINHGELLCRNGNAILFRTDTGATYAVNGAAHGTGYRNIDHIWKTDQTGEKTGTMGPLISRGQRLCDE